MPGGCWVICGGVSVTNCRYTPVNLAYRSFDPVEETDETLSPIIFLHGVTLSYEIWWDIPQIIANETKRKVYAVDARNHGDTEWTDEFNFDMNADDLLHFMDSISAPKAILVGHSMGGVTSIRAALKSPQRIDMVFVEDMYLKNPDQAILDYVVSFVNLSEEAVASLSAECPEDVMREVMKFMAEKTTDPSLQHAFNEDETTMCKVKLPVKRDANGRFILKANTAVITKALKNGDTLLTEAKGLYNGPAYFIYGTVSPFKVNEDEENILKFFPNAELIPVENADHSVHIRFEEEFIDIVVQRILKHQS